MELTYMNSLLEDLKGRVERATLRSTNISLFPETVQALVAEIERQREEIAALQEALEAVRKEAMRIRSSSTRDEDRYYGIIEIANTAETALNMDATPVDNAPAPEPAPRRPRLGDTLVNAITEGKTIVVKDTGERGVVFKIFYSELLRKRQYRIEFTNGEYCDYDRDEIERA